MITLTIRLEEKDLEDLRRIHESDYRHIPFSAFVRHILIMYAEKEKTTAAMLDDMAGEAME